MTSTTTSSRAVASSSTPVPSVPPRVATGRLGAAQARWNDYLGTAAADDSSPMLASRSLYEITDLDRDRWTIVGIDASLGDPSDQVVLYAVDRRLKPNIATAGEQIPVTAFHVDSARVEEFLREAFQRVTLRLVSTLAVDRDLLVKKHVVLA